MTLEDERERRVLVERHDQADRLQCGKHGEPVFERIDRPTVALAQATYRRIGVDADDERGAERARPGKIGHVAAMYDVEHAVGENPGSRQCPEARTQRRSCRDLGGERRLRRRALGSRHPAMYSKTLTTRCTPLVVLAMSEAASPSPRRTTPIR